MRIIWNSCEFKPTSVPIDIFNMLYIKIYKQIHKSRMLLSWRLRGNASLWLKSAWLPIQNQVVSVSGCTVSSGMEQKTWRRGIFSEKDKVEELILQKMLGDIAYLSPVFSMLHFARKFPLYDIGDHNSPSCWENLQQWWIEQLDQNLQQELHKPGMTKL